MTRPEWWTEGETAGELHGGHAEEHSEDEFAAVRAIIDARRARSQIMSGELFADPAWDILLELYAASLAQRRVSILELAAASAVPATTALRWIDKLGSAGLIRRIDDPLDRRRVWVEISREGRTRMRAWLGAVRSRPRA